MTSGIESLKVLSHMQAASASDDAADAANKGRDLLIEQKNVRARQQAFERAVGDKALTEKEYADLNAMLGEVGMTKEGVDYTYGGVLGHYSGGAGTFDRRRNQRVVRRRSWASCPDATRVQQFASFRLGRVRVACASANIERWVGSSMDSCCPAGTGTL